MVVTRRFAVVAVGCALVVGLVAGGVGLDGSTAAAPAPAGVRDRALALLRSRAGRYLTPNALRGLQELAGVGPGAFGARSESDRAGGSAGPVAAPAPSAGLPNVRVNDPRQDLAAPDQSTQSETAIAVHGTNVVVGFNDTQQSVPYRPTAGTTISGVAYSSNGGDSFTDAGAIPNAGGFINLGDPWLATDRAGNFFYSTLMLGGESVAVGVASSTDGGRTFGAPIPASPTTGFYQSDKPALAVGRDPGVAARDDVYLAWDDFRFDDTTGATVSGLPVARSTDGGRTWTTTYADRFATTDGCGFRQYIGAQPLVDPGSGVLRVFAERIEATDCLGAPHFSQWVFTSLDGGRTFARRKIDDVTPVSDTGLVTVGPGQGIRTIEFPTVAQRGSTLYAVWNDGGRGSADLRIATSTNGGSAWSKTWLTGGGDDDLMPAIAADLSGVHVAFYRVGGAGIALDAADSADGATFSLSRVSTTTFPGSLTVPQFDPFVADGYMGDYVALVSDGARRFYAWGDNRNRVVDSLYPQGRADPDVYFGHS